MPISGNAGSVCGFTQWWPCSCIARNACRRLWFFLSRGTGKLESAPVDKEAQKAMFLKRLGRGWCSYFILIVIIFSFSGSLVKYAYKKIIKRMRAEIALMLDVITKIQSQRLCGSCKRRKVIFAASNISWAKSFSWSKMHGIIVVSFYGSHNKINEKIITIQQITEQNGFQINDFDRL